MKTYLSDILPRLKKYSQSLDQTAMLVDKPWVVNAGNNEYQKLIFKRDGTVFLSRNGDLTDGKWEYIPGANALAIDYGSRKVLYRHSYFDEAVLALQKDGAIGASQKELFLLSNETVIPDGNPERYLRAKYYDNVNVIQLVMADNELLLVESPSNNNNDIVGLTIHSESDIKLDGAYNSENGNLRYEVRNNKVYRVKKKLTFPGGGFVWSSGSEKPSIDDEIIGRSDGRHELEINGTLYKVDILRGRINKIKLAFWPFW